MKNFKLILAATIATASLASAHDTPNALTDSQGNAVKGGFGQCIEAVYNQANAECGHQAPVPKPKPAPIHEVPFALPASALFDTAKAILRPAGKARLNSLATQIQQAKQLGKIKNVTGVTVVGHTDSRGSKAYNQGLSERRANAVRTYLVQRGIPANIIQAYGEGEMNPVATNKTPAGRQQNRRVEVVIQGTQFKK